MMRVSRLLFCAIGIYCLAIAAQAQTYPSQPVRVINPHQAGGGLDLMCRTIAERLGERRAAAVVDPSLRVHGVQALRVVDSSIMPTIPSCNTNAASIMLGEKACDLILGRAARRE